MIRRLIEKLRRLLYKVAPSLSDRDEEKLPAAILDRLAAEMRKNVQSRSGHKWAPSEYRILLTKEAMRLILPIRTELQEELRAALASLAEKSGWRVDGPLQFNFDAGEGRGLEILSVGASPPPSAETNEGGMEADTASTKVYKLGRETGERAWLKVESGPDEGREYPLIMGTMLIGRHNTSHIRLNDLNVSRRHATLTHDGNGCELVDMGSTNGTFVNGNPIRKHRLEHGDRVKLGQTTLIFFLHHERG